MLLELERHVSRYGFKPGQIVADFGAGSGHVALSLAHELGPHGQVVAIDINEEPLVRLKHHSLEQGQNNIEIVMGDVAQYEGTGLKEESVDGVVIANLLSLTPNKAAVVRESARILKKGGRAVVIDRDTKFLPEAAEDIFNQSGFKLLGRFAPGRPNYGLAFKKL